MSAAVEFLSAVLLVSSQPERLVAFYRDALGLPLKEERHGETAPHYGCELGDVHFAIHPAEGLDERTPTTRGGIRLAFTVFDLPSLVEKLERTGHKVLYPPEDAGFATITALRDPDGNYVELTQLADSWFQHLERRRQGGHDVLARWKARRSG